MHGRKLGGLDRGDGGVAAGALAQAQTGSRQRRPAATTPAGATRGPVPASPRRRRPRARRAGRVHRARADRHASQLSPPPLPDVRRRRPTRTPRTRGQARRALEARWETSLYGFAELDLMQDTHPELRRRRRTTRCWRGRGRTPARTRATQFTANNSQLGLRIAAPAFQQMRTTGQVEMDFFGVLPADATEQTIYTLALGAHASLLPEARDAHLRSAGRPVLRPVRVGRRRLQSRQRRLPRPRGQVYHRQPQVRAVEVDPERGSCASTSPSPPFAPCSATPGVPDLEAGIRLAAPGVRTGSRRRASGSPSWRRSRSDSRPSAAASRSPSSCPTRASPRWRSAAASPRTCSFRSSPPRALAARRERAVAHRRALDRDRDLRPLHRAHRRRAVPDAAQPGRAGPAAALPARTSTRDRDLRRERQPQDHQLVGRLVGVQYYLPVDDGRIWVSANFSRSKSTNLASLTPGGEPRRNLHPAGLLRRQRVRRAHARRPARALGPGHAPDLRRHALRRRRRPRVEQPAGRGRLPAVLLAAAAARTGSGGRTDPRCRSGRGPRGSGCRSRRRRSRPARGAACCPRSGRADCPPSPSGRSSSRRSARRRCRRCSYSRRPGRRSRGCSGRRARWPPGSSDPW